MGVVVMFRLSLVNAAGFAPGERGCRYFSVLKIKTKKFLVAEQSNASHTVA
jgi:hypothetical protein